MKQLGLFLLIAALIFSATGCKNASPAVYVSLRDGGYEDGVKKLTWVVGNRSDRDLTFHDGDIMHYTIRGNQSNIRKEESKPGSGADLTLKAGETYEEIVKLENLEEDRYRTTFLAVWEDKKYAMAISFDID